MNKIKQSDAVKPKLTPIVSKNNKTKNKFIEFVLSIHMKQEYKPDVYKLE